jgi:hypothetical protein
VIGIYSLNAVRSGSRGPYVMLIVLALAFAAGLYVVSTVDAGRAARREPPLLAMRVLLYAGVGLVLTALVLLTIAALQARG